MIRLEFETAEDFRRFVLKASAIRLEYGYCCEECEEHTPTQFVGERRICAECELREYATEEAETA